MAETTLDQLAASISRRAGQYAAGTATGGTTTTLVDASLIQPDNSWNNCYVRILSGTYAGLERLISAFDQATATITFTPALAGAIVAGVTYEISPLQRSDIVQAVQDAIRNAGNAWMQIKESYETFTSTQLYNLAADVVAVLEVLVYSTDNSGDSNGIWKPLLDWSVTGVPGARKLMLRSWNAQIRSYAATIRYIAMPTLMAAAGDDLNLGEVAERQALAYVQEYALHVVHEMLMARNVTGEMARAHLTLANSHLAKAQQIMAMRDVRRETRQMKGWRVGSQV